MPKWTLLAIVLACIFGYIALKIIHWAIDLETRRKNTPEWRQRKLQEMTSMEPSSRKPEQRRS
jgi:hypothetical protein